MGRRSAVPAAVVGFVLFATGCGGGDDASGPADALDTHSAGDTAEVTGPDACPEPGGPPPGVLETGVVVEYPDGGATHVACDQGYDHAPPTSGSHFDAWQNCGFYDAPVRDYTAVHALEHGAVWIAYQPDLDPAMLAEIEAVVATETHLLAAPYPGLGNPLVLSAWRRQLAVDTWSDPAVSRFLADFTGRRSTTAPEAGASCEGAVGRPPDDPDAGLAAIFDQIG